MHFDFTKWAGVNSILACSPAKLAKFFNGARLHQAAAKITVDFDTLEKIPDVPGLDNGANTLCGAYAEHGMMTVLYVCLVVSFDFVKDWCGLLLNNYWTIQP